MMLASLYIIAMPTLYSAMTSYVPILDPSIVFNPGPYGSEGNVRQCGTRASYNVPYGPGGFNAGWGVLVDSRRIGYGGSIAIAAYVENEGLRKYYERYKDQYVAAGEDSRCKHVPRSACPPLMRPSTLEYYGYYHNLSAPLLDIQTWGTASDGLPNVWLCNGMILQTEDLHSGNVTGICNAGGDGYQWGFSFLLLFFTCLLQFLWGAIMYGLWLQARRGAGAERSQAAENMAEKPSVLASAVAMVSQAEQQYGEDIKGWTSKELEKVVWKGPDTSTSHLLRSSDHRASIMVCSHHVAL